MHKGVRLLTELPRLKANYHVERRKVFGPSHLAMRECLHGGKILEVFVIGDNVDCVDGGLKVMSPRFEGLEDR